MRCLAVWLNEWPKSVSWWGKLNCRNWVILRQHHGYFDHETGEWDYKTGDNRSYPHEANNSWRLPDGSEWPAGTIDAWSGMPFDS